MKHGNLKQVNIGPNRLHTIKLTRKTATVLLCLILWVSSLHIFTFKVHHGGNYLLFFPEVKSNIIPNISNSRLNKKPNNNTVSSKLRIIDYTLKDVK